MLVRNRLELESHCPRWWGATIGACAVALVLIAATFGETAAPRAKGEETAAAVRDESDEGSDVGGDAEVRPSTLAVSPSPDESDETASVEGQIAGEDVPVGEGAEPTELKPAKPLSDADRKKLLTKLATRASLHPQGAVQFVAGSSWQGQQQRNAEFLYAAAGDSWVLRPAVGKRVGDTTYRQPATGLLTHSGTFTLVHDGRCFSGAEDVTASDGENSRLFRTARLAGLPQVRQGAQLHIRYVESVAAVRERQTAYGLGTIYYETGRRFIAEHSSKARFPGTQRLYGLDVRVAEWDVAPDDAEEAFGISNDFLAMGGLLRICIALGRDDEVVRIEGIDRFGTRQFRADSWGYEGRVAGTAFPHHGRIESGAALATFDVTGLTAEVPQEEFTLNIPGGIRVIDVRPKEEDQFLNPPGGGQPRGFGGRGRGAFGPGAGPPAGLGAAPQQALATFVANSGEYPLHSFTTSAPYPKGFPKKLLVELDRDVLPWERGAEWAMQVPQPGMGMGGPGMMGGMGMGGMAQAPIPAPPPSLATLLSISQNYAAQAVAQPSETPANRQKRVNSSAPNARRGTAASEKSDASTDASAKPSRQKRTVSYGGKSFDEWRTELLTDLEPETRVKALTALGAFGANGYAEEAAAAIGEVLKGEEAGDNHLVASAAFQALARCGAAAVPVLETQLGRDRVRGDAVSALVNLAGSTDAVVPALLKIGDDSDSNRRGSAFKALAAHYLNRAEVEPALARALGDDPIVRRQVIVGLAKCRGSADKIAKLLAMELNDEDRLVRADAAATFACKAVPTPENVRLLEESILAGGFNDRRLFVHELQQKQNQAVPFVPELAIPAIAAVLKADDTYAGSLNEIQFVVNAVRLLGNLARGESAKGVIPVLTDAIDLALPTGMPPLDGRLQIAAVDVAGQIGPPAAELLPHLKRWLEPDAMSAERFAQMQLESPKQWRTHIEAAIRKIERK
jgi:hypothetical protein